MMATAASRPALLDLGGQPLAKATLEVGRLDRGDLSLGHHGLYGRRTESVSNARVQQLRHEAHKRVGWQRLRARTHRRKKGPRRGITALASHRLLIEKAGVVQQLQTHRGKMFMGPRKLRSPVPPRIDPERQQDAEDDHYALRKNTRPLNPCCLRNTESSSSVRSTDSTARSPSQGGQRDRQAYKKDALRE